MDKKKKWLLISLAITAVSQLGMRFYFNSESQPTTTIEDGIAASKAYEEAQKNAQQNQNAAQFSANATQQPLSQSLSMNGGVGQGQDSTHDGSSLAQPKKKIPFVRSSQEVIALHAHLDLPLNFGSAPRTPASSSQEALLTTQQQAISLDVDDFSQTPNESKKVDEAL